MHAPPGETTAPRRIRHDRTVVDVGPPASAGRTRCAPVDAVSAGPSLLLSACGPDPRATPRPRCAPWWRMRA